MNCMYLPETIQFIVKFHVQYLQLCLKEEERIITVDEHYND